VTSCRSDAYHAQKAPGSTSMLPRKAPSALKTFHELAVGVKDAYDAVGKTPTKPDEKAEGFKSLPYYEREARKVLWEFMGNINFLLSLVDEVATDSATRGALKDDAAFKNLRDVIKRCNKVLERMLVRRDNKYTLFFRLIQSHDTKDLAKMKLWNDRVESAMSDFLSSNHDDAASYTSNSSRGRDFDGDDGASVASEASTDSKNSRGMLSRGRDLLRTAGRVRTRRATPTPMMRDKYQNRKEATSAFTSMAGEDGYAVSKPVTSETLDQVQLSGPGMKQENNTSSMMPKNLLQKKIVKQPLANINSNNNMVRPKDELVGMIRELRAEKQSNEIHDQGPKLADFKPNWMPKADIPTTVPILPVEYIHRHRLMKQVVNSLINRTGPDAESSDNSASHVITSITSRHADKAGNGKTTLAVAAIQSVEVRERFVDGIAWIQLGRNSLSDKDIRRLYEEIYDQLLLQRNIDVKENVVPPSANNDNGSKVGNITRGISRKFSDESNKDGSKKSRNSRNEAIIASVVLESKRKFKSNDLEGMKEDLGRLLHKKNVLICLDDVWRPADAQRFIFDTCHDDSVSSSTTTTSINNKKNAAQCPYRFLITTRTPGLLEGAEQANEVFVRIFSEHEAVKLLLYSAGRRLHGGKTAPAFNQARVIVKGCGNSPLALRLAGGMLRTSNRNWTLSSPAWVSLIDQCKASLEEASKIRSFVNSVGRIADMSFIVVPDLVLRASLRRCFVTFAMVFRDNDWLLTGKGIPRGIVGRLFLNVISGISTESNIAVSPDIIIDMLEHMNFFCRARHGTTFQSYKSEGQSSVSSQSGKSLMNGSISLEEDLPDDEMEADEALFAGRADALHVEHTSYLMHESIKHIAEEMATRPSSSFGPKSDEFTSFDAELEEEEQRETKSQTGWLSNVAKSIFSSHREENLTSGEASSDRKFHELMVCALRNDANSNDVTLDKKDCAEFSKCEKVERYISSYLPSHLIRAQMLKDAGALLLDFEFIKSRIRWLGNIEAVKRHMSDLVDVRRQVQKMTRSSSSGDERTDAIPKDILKIESRDSDTIDNPPQEPNGNDLDIARTQREACRRLIDAIHRDESQLSSKAGNSINIAFCLTLVGEFLLKARITSDAVSRFEEALDFFRKHLGNHHVEVARGLNALGKAYVKAGEPRLALLKLTEAYKIYSHCDSLKQHDAISNTLLMASLLVEIGDWDNAAARFDEVIATKQQVYGPNSYTVAKAMNDYAILLAKHSRMSESLRQYEVARGVYTKIDNQGSKDEIGKFSFDITLIDLNIASIKSKLGNYHGALKSYEKGVEGLRSHIAKEKTAGESIDTNRLAAQKRHLVSAIGRIGSMRMKLKDNTGALKAYLTLIKEVDKKSPTPSQNEKARAHVKCATIFRQAGTSENNALARSHLTQALQMYTILHGASHKDTKAIGASLRQWEKIDNS